MHKVIIKVFNNVLDS